ncbi:MAG: hypothetical protein M3O70_18275 [Actinomycetota bacterium]|nr:hypothetical protein [Actinomycetota bacterium]
MVEYRARGPREARDVAGLPTWQVGRLPPGMGPAGRLRCVCVASHAGQIPLVRCEHFLLGGGIHDGETARQAPRCELLQETVI